MIIHYAHIYIYRYIFFTVPYKNTNKHAMDNSLLIDAFPSTPPLPCLITKVRRMPTSNQ